MIGLILSLMERAVNAGLALEQVETLALQS